MLLSTNKNFIIQDKYHENNIGKVILRYSYKYNLVASLGLFHKFSKVLNFIFENK